jgi:hypothetical protein
MSEQSDSLYFTYDTSQATQIPSIVGSSESIGNATPSEIAYMQSMLDQQSEHFNVLKWMMRVSENTGGLVIMPAEFKYLPMLIGRDGVPVLLYNVVEEISCMVDYGDLQERFPTLSYAQVARIFDFLRKLTQFNVNGFDIDEFEDGFLENDTAFQNTLIESLSNMEEMRVLNIQ